MKCSECKEEVDEVVTIKVKGRSRKVCESCKDDLEADDEVSKEAESTIRGMMEYKGR